MAVVKARMNGWETRTFLERTSVHHRKMGTGMRKGIGVAFKGGRHDYLMGVSPIWQFCRSLYQMTRPPVFVFGGAILTGYVWGWIMRDRPLVSQEVIAFRRTEQWGRLKELFYRIVRALDRSKNKP